MTTSTEPADLPNGLSSALRSRGKEQPVPGGKKGAAPKAGRQGPRRKQVSKQSAAWDRLAAPESPEAQPAHTADSAAPLPATHCCTHEVPSSEAAAELARQKGKACNGQDAEPPAESGHTMNLLLGNDESAKVQAGSRVEAQPPAVEPSCNSRGPRERGSPFNQSEAAEQPLPLLESQQVEPQLQPPGQNPASTAAESSNGYA